MLGPEPQGPSQGQDRRSSKPLISALRGGLRQPPHYGLFWILRSGGLTRPSWARTLTWGRSSLGLASIQAGGSVNHIPTHKNFTQVAKGHRGIEVSGPEYRLVGVRARLYRSWVSRSEHHPPSLYSLVPRYLVVNKVIIKSTNSFVVELRK